MNTNTQAPNEHYRYQATYTWQPDRKQVCFILHNPTLVAHEQTDPTTRKCIMFARVWGYGSLVVVNLFARRADSPQRLAKMTDPVGVDNDRYIVEAALAADRVVVAWGSKGDYVNRSNQVLALLQEHGVQPYCLKRTKWGDPYQPLYVALATNPVLY